MDALIARLLIELPESRFHLSKVRKLNLGRPGVRLASDPVPIMLQFAALTPSIATKCANICSDELEIE